MQLPGWSCKGNDAQVSLDILKSVVERVGRGVLVGIARVPTNTQCFWTLHPHLRQDSIDGVAALREHQVFVEHEVEGEGFAEGVGADPGLLRAVLLEAVQVLIEGLLL